MKITILGSGTSTGVPVIGCPCAVCSSPDIRNKRTRASIAVQEGSETLLIDTSPEMRLQVLAAGIVDISAVLYTHTHADHTQGFDDLRGFYFRSRKAVDCYLMEEYHAEFRERFRYAFEDTGYQGATPQVNLKAMPLARFNLGSFVIDPVRLPHGHVNTCGFRFGNFVYATDFKRFPADVIEKWRGHIHTMVASGIHFGTHKAHSVIPETIELFRQLGVKRGIISHLAHDVDYAKHNAEMPPGVELAYDGMTIDLGATVS